MNDLLTDSKIFLQEYGILDRKQLKNLSSSASLSGFIGIFGVSPHVCSLLWQMVKEKINIKHKHLLWTLYFLRHYPTHHEMSFWCGVSRVTVHKYIWNIINVISKLPLVSLHLCDIFINLYY